MINTSTKFDGVYIAKPTNPGTPTPFRASRGRKQNSNNSNKIKWLECSQPMKIKMENSVVNEQAENYVILMCNVCTVRFS
jgi:hypothetical protein